MAKPKTVTISENWADQIITMLELLRSYAGEDNQSASRLGVIDQMIIRMKVAKQISQQEDQCNQLKQ